MLNFFFVETLINDFFFLQDTLMNRNFNRTTCIFKLQNFE